MTAGRAPRMDGTGRRLSVVIPSFNCARYLCEALDSVLAQLSSDDEVIVVDDGSTDDTTAVLLRYSGRVRSVEQVNSGVANARNRGIALSRGEWLLFLDADDRLQPGAIDRLMAGSDRSAVVYGDKNRIAEDGTFLDQVSNRDCTGAVPAAARTCFGGAAFEPGCAIVPRHLAVELGGFDQRYAPCEDRHFWVRCGALVEFVHVPAAVMDYRVRPGSHSSHRARQVTASVRARIDLLGWFRDRGIRVFDQDPTRSEILGADLASVYWSREWEVVDALLGLASEYDVRSPEIDNIRRRRRIPAWMLAAKDRLDRLLSRASRT